MLPHSPPTGRKREREREKRRRKSLSLFFQWLGLQLEVAPNCHIMWYLFPHSVRHSEGPLCSNWLDDSLPHATRCGGMYVMIPEFFLHPCNCVVSTVLSAQPCGLPGCHFTSTPPDRVLTCRGGRLAGGTGDGSSLARSRFRDYSACFRPFPAIWS
jgi:hypothetical protein